MKVTRFHTGWAVKIWVLVTVFLLPFLGPLQVLGWVAFGAALGLAWKLSPEAPAEAPVEPLPYVENYKHKEIPRPEPVPPPKE